MRYFMDTEFAEDGKTIELISIGIVCEDGREYYAVAVEGATAAHSSANDWVKKNVLPLLPPKDYDFPMRDIEGNLRLGRGVWKPREQIAQDIINFVGCVKTGPEFWAYFADYDWVVLCQLYGRMIDLPKGWPFYCQDIKQLMWHLGVEKEAVAQKGDEHNALNDARWNADMFAYLQGYASSHSPRLKV